MLRVLFGGSQKRLGRSVQKIAAARAVGMNFDKARRNILAFCVNNVIKSQIFIGYGKDFFIFYIYVQLIANTVFKDHASACDFRNHAFFSLISCFYHYIPKHRKLQRSIFQKGLTNKGFCITIEAEAKYNL